MNNASDHGIRAVFSHDYGPFSLNVDLELPARGVTIIFGRSGSGKTTLLRCVAGLNSRAEGFLSVNGEVWQDNSSGLFIPVHQRDIGYVFQDGRLFPHLTVLQNLQFGMQRVAPCVRNTAFDQTLDLLEIRPLLQRFTGSLSGGEQQRVGIARALLTSPRLLLMDEPLAALDIRLKKEVLPYLEHLRDVLEIPVLYVTHSLDELAQLGDHLVILEGGQVVCEGTLPALLGEVDYLSAITDEPGAVLDAVVSAHDADNLLTRLTFGDNLLMVSLRSEPPGSRLRCRVASTDVSLSLTKATDTSIMNIFPATIRAIRPGRHAGEMMVQLDVGTGCQLLACVTQFSCTRLDLAPGIKVHAQIKAVAVLK